MKSGILLAECIKSSHLLVHKIIFTAVSEPIICNTLLEDSEIFIAIEFCV